MHNGYGLGRDVALLEALASDEAGRTDGLGVAAVARLTGREKSQVSRALRALADAGLVERDEDTLVYRLGWRLFSLAARFLLSGLLGVIIARAMGQSWHLTRAQWRATFLFGDLPFRGRPY